MLPSRLHSPAAIVAKFVVAGVVFAGVLFAVLLSPVFVRRVSGFVARILTTRKFGIKIRAERPELGFQISGATYLNVLN